MTTTAHHARRPARRTSTRTVDLATARYHSDEDITSTLTDAIAASMTARLDAERSLRTAETARSHAGRALEQHLWPMRIDEATRAGLRAVYAAADADVSRRRDELARARALEQAALTVQDAVTRPARDAERTTAMGIGGILAAWQSLRDTGGGVQPAY